MTLDPAAARVLAMLVGAEARDASVTAEDRRLSLRQLAELAAGPADPAVAAEPYIYRRRGPRGPLALRRYRPVEEAEGPGGLIVYLHGGGWVAGDLDTHDRVCRALAAHSRCQLLAVHYRRPPEHPFPAPVEDAVEVLAWARRQARRLGADPRRIVLAGDSAGANLAAAAAGWFAARGRAAARLIVLFCPILEIAPTQPSRSEYGDGYFLDRRRMAEDVTAYLGDLTEADSPLASPLRIEHPADFPPTHLHLAEYDPFRDEGLAFAARLRAAGVPVCAEVHPGMIHYFYALPRLIPYARAALAKAGEAIAQALSNSSAGAES
ncbi:MAG: alpha/beta hydrolase [Caulobacteraceae bacterium]|nr:alpha/beta hydrolase [Caulobacteraceae bacterium]